MHFFFFQHVFQHISVLLQKLAYQFLTCFLVGVHVTQYLVFARQLFTSVSLFLLTVLLFILFFSNEFLLPLPIFSKRNLKFILMQIVFCDVIFFHIKFKHLKKHLLSINFLKRETKHIRFSHLHGKGTCLTISTKACFLS